MTKVRKRSVSLTPDLDDAIQQRVAAGAYASQSEVIRAALRALAHAEEERERKLGALDTAIERGIADADAGRVHPAENVFAELRARYKSMADDGKK